MYRDNVGIVESRDVQAGFTLVDIVDDGHLALQAWKVPANGVGHVPMHLDDVLLVSGHTERGQDGVGDGRAQADNMVVGRPVEIGPARGHQDLATLGAEGSAGPMGVK